MKRSCENCLHDCADKVGFLACGSYSPNKKIVQALEAENKVLKDKIEEQRKALWIGVGAYRKIIQILAPSSPMLKAEFTPQPWIAQARKEVERG